MSPRPSVEEERREAVLAATCGLITELGYSRVRIADIAERVGISTGTVHYYFDTKDDLLEETFRYAVRQARRRSERALDGVDDPWERLVALLRTHLPRGDARREWLLWIQLWSEALAQPSLRKLNEESYASWVELVESIVQEGQDRGAFRAVDAHAFTLRLLTMLDGLVIQHVMGSTDVTLGGIHELLVGFARAELLAGEPSRPERRP
jgi:AcrR family transcriptional regulator